MQKIKNAILNKLIERHVSDAELSVLLHIAHYQSDQGLVTGVYYRDVCKELGIAHQTFYNAIRGLEHKGIIKQNKCSYFDIDVLIVDNDFRDCHKAMKEGYLNLGADLFKCPAFLALKANEKLLAMYIFKIAKSGRGSYHIGVDNFYDKFCRLFDVSRRIIQRYLTSLRKLFSIGIKEGKYWITPLRNLVKGSYRTDKDLFTDNVAHTSLRRNKAKYSKQDYMDIKGVVGNYYEKCMDCIQTAIDAAIDQFFHLRNQHKSKYKWDRRVELPYIHKLLQEQLAGATETITA